MNPSRETVYAALYARLEKAAGFVTTSRRLKHWSDVPPEAQPALFIAQRTEQVTRAPGLNPVYDLGVDVYLYAQTTEAEDSPASAINPLMDAVDAALAPDNVMTNKCTLGGLVQHAWIEGQIETDEGLLGEQGVAIIPIRIRVV